MNWVGGNAESVNGMRRLGGAVLANAGIRPDSPAITEKGRTWTYAQLAEAVRDVVRSLRDVGIRPGDRVMIIGENGLELAALIIAMSEIDAWVVLENARRAPDEVDRLRDHCEPRRILYATSNSDAAAAHADRHGVKGRGLGRLPGVAIGELAPDSVPESVHEAPGEQVAALIYTTGTTGAPKGVMLTHGNLLYLAAMMRKLRHLTPDDKVYCVLPITHVMGLGVVFFGALIGGAHLYIVPRFDAESCLLDLDKHGITVLQGAPAMFAKLASCAKQRQLAVPRLRFIGAGGAPIDQALKRETESIFGLPLHNGYGLTEASALCWTRIDRPRNDASIGLPIPGVELSILDAEGKEVSRGQTGELWARGPNVMKGYFRDDALTASVTKPGGWFNTQDLARIGEDEHLFIEGRTKDLIISSGFNVYPAEVETALNTHPNVVHSAVLSRKREGNEQIVAFIELVSGATLTHDELSTHLASRISPYKRPVEVFSIAALPTSLNGKVLKTALQRFADEPDRYVHTDCIRRLPMTTTTCPHD